MRKNHLKGIFSTLFGVMLYGAYGIFSRLISSNFATYSQNYVRSIIIIIILFLLIFFNKNKEDFSFKKIKKTDLKWFILWSLSGSIPMLLLFDAFNNLPIGTAYFLFYSTMILTGYLTGKFLFKEKLNTIKMTSMFFALTGLLIIYVNKIEAFSLFYMFLSLISGFFIGIWNTFSKKISNNYSTPQMMIISSLITAGVAIIGALFTQETLAFTLNWAWFWILIYAFAELAASYFIITGFKNLEAQVASIIMPVEVIFATLFGFIFYKEVLPRTVFIGGLFIATAAFFPSLINLKKKTKKD